MKPENSETLRMVFFDDQGRGVGADVEVDATRVETLRALALLPEWAFENACWAVLVTRTRRRSTFARLRKAALRWSPLLARRLKIRSRRAGAQ